MRNLGCFVTLALFSLSLVAVGCGDEDNDDDGGSSTSGATTSCRALCTAQYEACPDALDFCNQLCAVLVPSFTADCEAKATTYYDCASQIEWECSSILANQVDPTLCQAEQEAYDPCIM